MITPEDRVQWTADKLPHMDIGRREDMDKVLAHLGIEKMGDPPTPLVVAMRKEGRDSVLLERRTIIAERIPNVVGMGLRDALYQLENLGVKVRVNGVGKVIRQSLIPGTDPRNQTITLTLN